MIQEAKELIMQDSLFLSIPVSLSLPPLYPHHPLPPPFCIFLLHSFYLLYPPSPPPSPFLIKSLT